MNADTIPFRLIIVNDSPAETQRLTSMLQNSGKPCRAQHIDNEGSFNKIIEEQRWDLVIAHSDAQALTPVEIIRTIRKYNQDLPLILLTDDEKERVVVNGMKSGACDVVKLDDDQHLLLVIDRELANRQYRKNARVIERKIKELEHRNQQLLNSSKDGIAFIQDGLYVYANDSFAEMCGYNSRDDIECLPIMDMIVQSDLDNVKKTLKNFAPQSNEKQENRLSFQVKTEAGTVKEIEAELEASHFDEEPCIKLFVETKLDDILHTDETTGLYNKTYLTDTLRNLVIDATTNEKTYSLFYIDIDQFEERVNGTVGIEGSDLILSTVAGFLQSRGNEEDILARFNDHSFIIASYEHNLERLLNTGNILCQLIREHFFEVNSKTIRLTASIGISIINETTIDAQASINQACQAIEVLRKKHKNGIGDGVNIFNTEEGEQTVLVGSLQKALKEGNFRLLFQPVISLRGGDTERYEVLLRMLDENDKEISPNHFLKTAESMKLTSKIDRWVILESIKHLSHNNKRAERAQLIIHITHQTLCDESIIPWLKVAIQAAKVDPSYLILQIRETLIIQYLTAAKKFIADAQAIGIDFCVSHFGCEIEPMFLFEHVDIEKIKIDESFSLDMQENPDNIAVTERLIAELHARNKKITVPMVENASILSKLWKMGVHCIQGNYLQPPGAAMDYEFSVENTG